MTSALRFEVTRLSDEELIAQVSDLARQERAVIVDLVAHLAELDLRKLFLDQGCASLFAYCVEVLHFSEYEAYTRIETARAVLECPPVLDLLAAGELSLTTVGLLRPYLQGPNHANILAAARLKSKREVEKLVADLRPLPDVPASVRKMATPATHIDASCDSATATNGAGAACPTGTELPLLDAPAGAEPNASAPTKSLAMPVSHRPVIAPLGNERYKFQFMVSAETYAVFERAQALLRHVIPNGDPAAIVDRAFRLLVKDLERTRLAAAQKPRTKAEAAATNEPQQKEAAPSTDRPGSNSRAASTIDLAGKDDGGSRHIPHELVRQVYARDGHRCTQTSPSGRRCSKKDGLQIDHVKPLAAGGETKLENLRLLCRAHNLHVARKYFGREKVDRSIRESQDRAKRKGQNRARRTSQDRATRTSQDRAAQKSPDPRPSPQDANGAISPSHDGPSSRTEGG